MSTTDTTTAVPLGTTPSFGFGDRLGLAGPGHVKSLLAHTSGGGGIRGIIAQQSIREMARTDRQPADVMAAARAAVTEAGLDQPWGADADHLKTPADVDRTADAGFTFFTIDPSAHVDQEADDYDEEMVDSKYELVKEACPWVGDYAGKTIDVPDGPAIAFDDAAVRRAAVKYGRAIEEAIKLADHIKAAAGQRGLDHEIEISVDETEQPTTLAEHYIIAEQLIRHGVKLVSLAPRYIGDFEKGVDYKGDVRELEDSLDQHAAVARHLGPYKLSLHSGSDKLSMYPAFARATRGMFHVKTAGTSYLEALRVVARHDPALFRRIIDFSRAKYDTDRATYHVSAVVADVPAPAGVTDNTELEKLYLQRWEDTPEGVGFTEPGRQVLHVTFGSVMTDPGLGDAARDVLEAHPDTHRDILATHFAKHLDALAAGLS